MSIGSSLWNGVSGLNSFSTAMTVVSDNIANAATTGFKAGNVHFGDMVNTYLALQSDSVQSEGGGSAILGIASDFAQGNLQTTTKWSDLAVSGEGFFVLKGTNSDGSELATDYYSRDGAFRLDDEGFLVNLQGFRVQGYEGDGAGGFDGELSSVQIALDQNYQSFRVDRDGAIHAINPEAELEEDRDVVVYKTGLAKFINDDGLVRQGGNLYIAGPNTGTTILNGDADALGFGTINDNKLESSNVDMAKEMINMIIYQSSYNANSKTITTSRDMLDQTINLVR